MLFQISKRSRPTLNLETLHQSHHSTIASVLVHRQHKKFVAATALSTMASAPGSSSKADPVIDVVDDSDNNDDSDEDSVDEEQLQEYREMVENLGNFAVRMLTTKVYAVPPPPCHLEGQPQDFFPCFWLLFKNVSFLPSLVSLYLLTRRTRCKSAVSPWWRRTLARRKRVPKQSTI